MSGRVGQRYMTTKTRNLRKAVSDGLVRSGFVRTDRVHVKNVDDEFSLWVDTGPLGNRSDIAPFVGIRHHPTEDLRARLMGSEPHTTSGTVGANVGYVLGQGYQWWEPPVEPEEVLTAINAALDTLRPLLSIDRLSVVWEIEGARRPGWQYSQIALELIRGDREAVNRCLLAAQDDLCKRDDEVCEQFRAFAKRVTQLLEAQADRSRSASSDQR